MANYMCSCRTNYFKVKDVCAFSEWAEQYHVEVIRDDHDKFGLLGMDDDGGGWPNWDHEKDEEIDFVGELAEHLQDGEVAVLMEVGAEKLRYLIGQAIAVRSDGEILHVTLGDIYDKVVEEWGGKRPTAAEY